MAERRKRWQDWEDQPNYEKIRRRRGSQPVKPHELFLGPEDWIAGPGQFKARVVEVHKRYCFIAREGESGGLNTRDVWLATVAKRFLTNDRSERNFVTVGDHVLCEEVREGEKVSKEDLPQCVIQGALRRRNQIFRTDPLRAHRFHILAANLDRVVVVASVINPAVKWGFIDRLLVIAENEGIPVTLVFNKFDLADDDPAGFSEARGRAECYEAMGYEVFRIAGGSGGFRETQEFAQLGRVFSGGTTLIAGQSGVGKSSLVNQFDPDIVQAVEENDDIFYKGRHTTTFASFLRIDNDGFLIDTPGVKSFGLPWTDGARLAHGFREFGVFASSCQYRECLHIHEPVCGVKAAVEKKQIAHWRYKSYLGICLGYTGREGRAGTMEEQ